MKKVIVLTAIVLALLGTYAFKRVDKRFGDIFKQLGVELPEAKGSILNDFVDGTLSFPHSDLYVKLALGKRAEAVKEIGDFIKKYTESAEFLELYKQAREEAKPHMESDEEKIQVRIETVKHDIETNEEDRKKTSNADMKKLYQLTLEQLKKEWKALTDQNDPQHDYYVKKAVKPSHWTPTVDSSEDLNYWKEDYPANVKDLIRKRLNQFLELTATIDFNARLVKRGDKMVFADPELEAKGVDWKYCFRSGKETIVAARAYAQQWLKELK